MLRPNPQNPSPRVVNYRSLYASAGLVVALRLTQTGIPQPAAEASVPVEPRIATAAAAVVSTLKSPEPTAVSTARVARSSSSAPKEVPQKPRKPVERMPALPEEFLAFDVSRPFGSRRSSFDAGKWEEFCRSSLLTGRRLVVVQARGSKTVNPYADLLLQGARQAGLRTAAYAFINFSHSAPSGDEQIRQALEASGAESRHLDFMVIDVESGAAGKMTQAERVNRIGQAVHAAATARLRPVIYAKNTGGRQGEWTDLTGNATDFSYLPLWVPRYDLLPRLDVDGSTERPWEPFGGWTARAGKQFADDRLTYAPHGLPADDNIFSRDVLEGTKEVRPYRVSGLVRVVASKPKRDSKSGEVVQAVKVVNQSLSPIVGPISVLLEGLSDHAPLANGHGTAQATGDPYVTIQSSTLSPGEAVRAELRFEKTSTGPPSFEVEVHAGHGDM